MSEPIEELDANSGRDREVEDLLRAYAETGDTRLRERLVTRHLGLVTSLAKRVSCQGEPIDDLVQVGYIGLIKAIDRFDPSRGVKFCSYAVPTIVGEMKRYLRDKSKVIRVPRHLQERRNLVRKAVHDLTQRLGRSPTLAEIAVELGLDPHDVMLLQEENLESPLSLDRFLDASKGSPGVLPLECVGEQDEEMLRVEDRFMVSRALESLTPRERAILYLLYYADLSQAQIGERLNMSQMHVSRLARTALNRLREELQDTA